MAQSYDKVFKENLEELVLPLATKLLHLSIPALEEIPDDLQTTIERKPDFLKKVIHPDSADDYILHFEFQTTDEPDMPVRMLEYFALLYRKYRLPIRQYVFYIGPGISGMESQLFLPALTFEYTLINAASVDYRIFMDSTVPEEVLLAILGDFRKHTASDVVANILSKLRELEKGGLRLARFIKQLEVLSKLRNLQETVIIESTKMALTYDLKTDIRYQQGMQQGMQQGEKKGIEKGIEEEKERFVRQLLAKNKLTVDEIAEVAEATVDQVEQIRLKMN